MPNFHDGIEELVTMGSITLFDNWQYALLSVALILGGLITASLVYYIIMCMGAGCRPKRYRYKISGTKNVVHLIALVFKIVIATLAVILAFQIVGVNILSIAIGVGVITYIVSYSLGDTLTGVGSLLFILWTNKVHDGLHIRIGDIEGHIDSICVGWINIIPINGSNEMIQVPTVQFVRNSVTIYYKKKRTNKAIYVT